MQSLPVLAVAHSGLRRAGLVVIDRKGRVRSARCKYLRRASCAAERLNLMRKEVESLIDNHNVSLVALGTLSRQTTETNLLGNTLRQACEEANVWLREIPLSRVATIPNGERDAAIAELAATYPELAGRLDFSKPSLFRNGDHERELRPLVDAFLLAHAIYTDVSRARP